MASVAGLLAVLATHDINVKNIDGAEDVRGIALALVGTAGLLIAVLWSLWRAHTIDETLKGVMLETAKTTSMVFIILNRRRHADLSVPRLRRRGFWSASISPACPEGSGRSSSW